MKSKIPRMIRLENPKLIAIRTNLRESLKSAVNEKIGQLQRTSSLYMDKFVQTGYLTPSQEKRHLSLSREIVDLMSQLRRSICVCYRNAGCFSYYEAKEKGFDPKKRPAHMDMVWIPENYKGGPRTTRLWICCNCFARCYGVLALSDILGT